MAVAMFLSIPDLTDEKGAPRPGTVVIDSVAYVRISDFSFSVANAGAVIVGTGAGQNQLELNPLTVTAPVDVLTPCCWPRLTRGRRIRVPPSSCRRAAPTRRLSRSSTTSQR